jgi:putative transposase
MINKKYALPVVRQCKILDLSRSSLYYLPEPTSEQTLNIMSLIDEIHLRYPFYGSRRIRDELWDNGFHVSRDRVRTLMKRMGVEALYRKPRLSTPHPGHKVYPYLLRGMKIDRANQVWAVDITYIPLSKGFVYLAAIMDWASRKVLSWRLSNTLDTSFCLDALEEAIEQFGCPEIFNSDQGCQFTSEAFTYKLKEHDIKISMDGRGRWMDNVFIERLWKSVKYEEVYLKGYDLIAIARKELRNYFTFYNRVRRHQGLNKKSPDEVYWKTLPLKIAA